MTQADLEQEIRETYRRYAETRTRIDAGELPWTALDEFFTEDATFIDPAWGRVEGIDAIREFLAESMAGLEDWDFPEMWTLVEGHRLVTMFRQIMGTNEDGSAIECPGVSILYYAGDGKFCYELDLMNMAQVNQALRDMSWQPGEGFNFPPKHPNYDSSLPEKYRHLALER
jgi:ketosteroid isomerase-like protein